MRPTLQLRPAQQMGLVKVAATLEDPLVRMESWEADMPLLTVEEGGVQLVLEFVSADTFRSFQRQVAVLELEDAHG